MLDKFAFFKKYQKNAPGLIIDYFYQELISEDDQKLINLAFNKSVSQSDLDNFLQNWDIEKYGEGKYLLLAYVTKENPDLKFGIYEKPRLEGLLKYHRFSNLKLIAHYSKIVKKLNTENITPLIFKGGAMKFLRPNLARAMGDIDILIFDKQEFEKSLEICENLGYST